MKLSLQLKHHSLISPYLPSSSLRQKAAAKKMMASSSGRLSMQNAHQHQTDYPLNNQHTVLKQKQSTEQVNVDHPWRTTANESPFPRKAIIQAVILLVVGTCWLLVGIVGYVSPYASETVVKMRFMSVIVGSLLFIPGAYYSRIAYYAWKRVPGFDFSQLPDD